MIYEKTKIIDGMEYKFLPLGAGQARTYLLRLINKLGPSLGQLVGGIKPQSKLSLDSDVMSELIPAVSDGFGNAISKILTEIDPAFYDDLVEVFVSRVSCCTEGKEVPLVKSYRELHFGTSLLKELKILCWALEAQYEDFFAPMRRALESAAKLMQKIEPQSSSQKE